MQTKNKKNVRHIDHIRRLTMNAMMVAMYYLLDGISIKLNDYMKISFNSFAVIICIILFGMLDGCIVAGVGELLIQAKFFGPFLPLFVLVQVARALVMGVFAEIVFAKKNYIERKPIWLYAMCIVGGLATSVLNSIVLFAYQTGMDYANLFKVPSWWWVSRIPAFSSTLVTAIVLATLAIPVARALRRMGIGRKIVLDEVKE